jgi:hypothetical protein
MTQETTETKRSMPKIGKWRRAGLLQKDWQILKVDQFEETGVEEWLTIEHVLQILKPLRVVSIKLSDGSRRGCPADNASGIMFYTRTPAEIDRAEEVAKS